MMNRRDALSRVALILGGTIIGAEAFLTGCKSNATISGIPFSIETINLLNEIAETILPATNTPGAKEAKVGEFMAVWVKDCYDEKDQKLFIEGINKLDEFCKTKNSKSFLESDAKQRTDCLNELNKEQEAFQKTKKPDEPQHYFRMIKELTLMGFFTSEIGATKVLRYEAVPGKFIGNYPYKKGDRAWATN